MNTPSHYAATVRRAAVAPPGKTIWIVSSEVGFYVLKIGKLEASGHVIIRADEPCSGLVNLVDGMREPLDNGSPASDDPKDVLTEIGRKFLELTWGPTVRSLSRIVYTEGGRNPEIADVFFENGYEEGYRQLGGYLQFQSPGLPEAEAHELARLFFAMLPGDGYDRLLAGASVQRTPEELERQISLTVEWLLWKLSDRK